MIYRALRLPLCLALVLAALPATAVQSTAQSVALSATQSATQNVAQNAVEITADIVYGHKDGMALTFDVFRPTENANGVGLLHMVSGGWVSRWAPPEEAIQRYRFLLDEGFTVFSVRHGSSPRYFVPEAYTDVKLAARFINLHADAFGVDAERLGVWGSSAGGHLSLMLGLTADAGDPDGDGPVESAPSRIAAVVAYFPPVDVRTWVGPSERFPALNFDPELADSVSPILHVTSAAPPILLMHGDEDTTVPISHSARIFEVLREQGITSEFITFPGQGHGFRGEDAARAQGEVVTWFTRHLVEAAVGAW